MTEGGPCFIATFNNLGEIESHVRHLIFLESEQYCSHFEHVEGLIRFSGVRVAYLGTDRGDPRDLQRHAQPRTEAEHDLGRVHTTLLLNC